MQEETVQRYMKYLFVWILFTMQIHPNSSLTHFTHFCPNFLWCIYLGYFLHRDVWKYLSLSYFAMYNKYCGITQIQEWENHYLIYFLPSNRSRYWLSSKCKYCFTLLSSWNSLLNLVQLYDEIRAFQKLIF